MALTLLRSFNTNEILGWSPVRFAEETEHWESVEMILIEGASTSDLGVTKRKLQESERAAIIFSELCRRRLVRLLSFALQQSPHLVQAELPLKRSPLHEAACSGCPATVRCLVSAGAAINAADDHGMTPLHEAAAHCNDYVVRILLDAGAIFDSTDNGGRTPLHYASRSGSVTCIRLLLAKGVTVDQVSADGCTALHEAATSYSGHAVRLLLDAGADKDAKSASGWTALHWAASRGRLYAVQVLLEAGATVYAKTVDEETPLHLAAPLTSTEVWDALVAAGADEGAVDKNGLTPKERAAEESMCTMAGCYNGGTNISDVSPDRSHVPPGAANDALLASNDDVCDSEDLSVENSTTLLSSVPVNSTDQLVRTSQEDEGTDVEECLLSLSDQTLAKEASNNSICVSEALSTENLTVYLSSVTLNSTTQQIITDSQQDKGTNVECMSVVSGQRTDSSSLCDEYSELGDATESTDETGSGEETESAEDTYSGDETASDEETGSSDEMDSDTDVEDGSSCISSANEEIDKLSERGSVNEPFSPVPTTSTVLYYEGPPLFHTLGTVGTSSKYNQRGTTFPGKFRGRGRGAPRGSRGNAAAYITRSMASLPRKENAVGSSQSQESGRHGKSYGKGIRKGNFNGSLTQQARGQGDVNSGQLNTVLCRTGSDQPHTKGQASMRDDCRNREPHVIEGKKNKKTKHSKSLSQREGDSNKEHKKKRRPDSQHSEGDHGNQHDIGHHSKRHGKGHHNKRRSEGHHSKRRSEGHHGNQQGEGHHGNQQGEGHHGNQQGEGYYGSRHGRGGHSNRSGENHHGNRHDEGYHYNQHGEHHRINRRGEAHHGNQFGEGHHGNDNYANRQGESRAGNWHGEGRGGNWRGGGRGGNSHSKSQRGRN